MNTPNGSRQLNLDDNVFTATTLQTSVVQKLTSNLRDIFVETNIIIRPDGIRILDMDKSNTIVVSMFLKATEFEVYECKAPEIKIGVTMSILAQQVHAAKSGYSLTMYITYDKYKNGVPVDLNMRIENGRGKNIDSTLTLIDTNSETYDYPDTEFDVQLRMLTADFQENMTISANTSQLIEISAVNKEIFFSAVTSRSNVRISDSHDDRAEKNGIHWIKYSNKVVQGVFSIKGLKCFTQCTGLCTECDIALANDAPIRVRYYPGTLGEIEFFHIPSPPSTN